MSKIAACSGGAGDILYSIPVLKQLGVTVIYIKENFYHAPHGNLHQTMKRIMESQGFEVRPCSGAFPVGTFDVPCDYNIDKFRDQTGRGTRHIQERMATHFGIKWDKGKPWLDIPVKDEGYACIHLTERWRQYSSVDWRKVLHGIKDPVKFLGFQHEWVDFCVNAGNVEWCPTDDVYDMAQVIAGCSRLYSNQSVALVCAQGLGKEYYLERKPGKTNTLLYGTNEHIL